LVDVSHKIKTLNHNSHFSAETVLAGFILVPVAEENSHYYYYMRLTAFLRTTWVIRHQKGKQILILLEQEMMGWQWHQLDHIQII